MGCETVGRAWHSVHVAFYGPFAKTWFVTRFCDTGAWWYSLCAPAMMDTDHLLRVPHDHIEHQHEAMATLILASYLRMRAAHAAMAIAATRLRAEGRDGWVVIIDHVADPDVEVARRRLRRVSSG
jgi:hypothetical protein